MAESVFYNKRYLCYVDESDFTDFQGIGTDPLYKRFNSVYSVIKHNISPEYQGFLAEPDYQEGRINWHVDNWKESPRCLNDLQGNERAVYERIKADTVKHYRDICSQLPIDDMQILAAAIKFIDDRFIYCYDGKVFLVAWGMRPDNNKRPVDGRWVKGLETVQTHSITFNTGDHGTLADMTRHKATRQAGTILTTKDIPEVVANEGYKFRGWSPDPRGFQVNDSVIFTAEYDEEVIIPEPEKEPEPPTPPTPMAEITFLPGEGGAIKGNNTILKPIGSVITEDDIPKVDSNKGMKFTGWNFRPNNMIVEKDFVFTAQYKKKSRFPKWLLWLLLGLLLTFLFLLLFRFCWHVGIEAVDVAKQLEQIDGRDDNGVVTPIIDDDGKLPVDDGDGYGYTAPVTGEDGQPLPIEDVDGRQIIANRLNIYFNDANADIQQWVYDFKKKYPGAEYTVVGMDRNVPMLQIQVPENERDKIREELQSASVFVLDESIMTCMQNSSNDIPAKYGWHLDAVGARNAWNITKGSNTVTVAIIDDGIQVDHPMLTGRYNKAYNVFRQDRKLSCGDGHGTHVAGLAAGSHVNLNKGAAGIAPNVKIMPIQVFDNEICTFSSLANGIMYAIHNGADVVNISLGPSFPELSAMSPEQQKKWKDVNLKNEEQVFKRIIDVANEKNVILVFAAGNEDILTAVMPECRTNRTINVAAVDEYLRPTDFTNYSVGTNISAPGVNIYSSFPGNGLMSMDGTSMAAPIVTGTVALMRSLNKDLNVTQILGILQKYGKATQDNNRYVPPMIQVDKALQAVKAGNINEKPSIVMQPIPKPGNSTTPTPKPAPNPNPGTNPKPAPGVDPTLQARLEDLIRQRDEIDNQIKDIKGQLGLKRVS